MSESTPHLDGESVRRLLREAVTERGKDYVYVSPYTGESGPGTVCYYVHDSRSEDGTPAAAPGCLVGLVLHKAGVSLDDLRGVGFQPADMALEDLRDAGLLTFEPDLTSLLGRVQARQDNGEPWGPVVRDALGS